MTGPVEALASGARFILDRSLTGRELGQFQKYMNLLVTWQRSQRLVGSAEPGWIVENVLLDSLLFLRLLPSPTESLVDLGSGAGVPGIPLKIVLADCAMTLVEARQRRASFLSTVVRELQLRDTRVLNARLEAPPPELEGRCDAVVMRCTGKIAELLPLATGFLRPGGLVVAAGPPEPAPMLDAKWTTVEGWKRGLTRRFAVHRR